MAAVAVALGGKSPFAIVADAAQLAGVDLVHRDCHCSLLHFREGLFVVALFTAGCRRVV